ncbi:MAG TPA: murein biosynthesis integral membrane protein MurJ [Patescibacteria group bacterium]
MIKKLVKNKFLNEKPTQSVAAAAFIISLAGVASRLLGMLRDRILAGQFGAGDTLDAYYAAFRIPDLIYNIMIVGALSAAFIPVFTQLITEKKEEQAWKVSYGVMSLQIYITSLVTALLVIFAPAVMHLVTPGYAGAKMDLTITLTRIMFLSPFLLGISGIISGVLMSFKKFLIYSLAPIFYNFGIIIGAVFFVRWMGPIGLAWGVVLGAFMHMLVQCPAVFFSGFRFRPMFLEAFRNKDVLQVLKLMAPRTITIAASQINFTIITGFASTLVSGSLAVFNFANNIQSAPLGLFGVSFAIAILPALSSLWAQGKQKEFIEAYSRTFRQIIFFVLPISALLFVLRAQTVRVLLGSGKFDWNDTITTFNTMGLLAISLFAQSLLPLLTRAFYAIQDTKTPLYITIASEASTLALVILLIPHFGVYGLALAFSASSVINMILLLVFLKKRLGDLDEKNIATSFLKIALASLIGGAAAQVAKIVVGTQGELDTLIAVLTQLVVAGAAGIAAFSIASYYLKTKEYFQFVDSISRKLFKAKKVITEDTAEVAGI